MKSAKIVTTLDSKLGHIYANYKVVTQSPGYQQVDVWSKWLQAMVAILRVFLLFFFESVLK